MPFAEPDAPLDRSHMQRSFSRAATLYEQNALLQREIAERMLEDLGDLNLNPAPRQILDLGCGTGYLSRGLAKLYPKARLFSLDIALPMLQQAQAHPVGLRRWLSPPRFVCADAYRLPIANARVDLLVSNLMLQWCPDYAQVFAEFARVLQPQGRLLFSTFGAGSLHELRDCWAQVDNAPHVHEFVDLHNLGDALLAAGLASPVMSMERITEYYPDSRAVMRHFKAIGAANAAQSRRRGLLGKSAWQQVQAAYEAKRDEQGLPLSYEIVYGFAQGVQQAKPPAPGEAVPLPMPARDKSSEN